MAISVFFIPSIRNKDKAVLRQLQLLGNGYGFEVSSAKRSRSIRLSRSTKQKLNAADVVIAIVTTELGLAAGAELAAADHLEEVPLLVFVEKDVAVGAPTKADVVKFTRKMNVKQFAKLVAQHLREQSKNLHPDTVTAIELLAVMGLSLLALATASSENQDT